MVPCRALLRFCISGSAQSLVEVPCKWFRAEPCRGSLYVVPRRAPLLILYLFLICKMKGVKAGVKLGEVCAGCVLSAGLFAVTEGHPARATCMLLCSTHFLQFFKRSNSHTIMLSA